LGLYIQHRKNSVSNQKLLLSVNTGNRKIVMDDAAHSANDYWKTKAMELDAEARQAFDQQDYIRSRQLFQQALEACRLAQWKEEIVYGLLHVTQVMSFEPDYEPATARPLLEEALQVAWQIGTNDYIIPVQINHTRLLIDEGKMMEGLRLAQETLRLAMEKPDPVIVNNLLTFIAIALANLGQAEAALRLFGSTEAERSRQGEKIGEPFLSILAKRLAPARNMLSKEQQMNAEAEGYDLSLKEAAQLALSIHMLE
jgi:hypothetical protein